MPSMHGFMVDNNVGRRFMRVKAFRRLRNRRPPAWLAGTLLATAIFSSSAVYPAELQPFQLGLYDPEQVFSNASNISLEHIFVHWQNFSAVEYRSLAQYAEARNRQL